ncbi:MAG TPA: MFS transporter [Nitrospirota bacterium]|nr:MFS transporter [Nitrospirota bacterium]
MPEKPTKIRWIVVALLLAISTVTFIDRVNISIAGKGLMSEYNIDSVTMGTIFSAFVLGYALFQIPGGWLGDKYGPRRLLTFVVVWWSIFTVLTAFAGDWFLVPMIGIVGSFMTVRFLVGIGEAAAYPNFNRTVANWMAPTERALGVGIANAGLGVGAAITPPLVAWIMVTYGWRTSFYITGIIGIVVVAVWYWYVTDRPDQHRSVNVAELAIIKGEEKSVPLAVPAASAGKISWRKILTSGQVWLIVSAYTLYGYIIYVYLSWFYLYLVNVKNFSILRGAVYSTLPFLAMAILAPTGGFISDRMIKRFSRRIARRSVAITGLVLCTLFIFFGARVADPIPAIIMLSLGAGFLYFTSGVFWSSCTDIAKAQTGTVSGMMNMGANIGGTVSPIATPFIAKTYGWDAAIQVAALCAIVAAALWLFINTEKKIDV